MADISKIKVPGGTTYDIKDATARESLVYFVKGPSTDTTAGTWTGTIPGLTEYYDGLSVVYVAAVAGASTTTLNINGLGAKTCYYTGTSKLTTHYAVGTPILLTYVGGYWRRADYGVSNPSNMSQTEASTGTATTARSISAKVLNDTIDEKIEEASYSGTSPIDVNGRVISHAMSGATAGAYGDTTAQEPLPNETFKVPSLSVDSYGHVTAVGAHNVTIPGANVLRDGNARYRTGTYPLYADALCVRTDQGYMTALTTTGGADNTEKEAIPTAFRPEKIFFSDTAAAASSAVGAKAIYLHTYCEDILNTFNTKPSTYSSIFLCGTYDPETGLFTLDNTSTTSWYKYQRYNAATASTFTAGKDYIRVGQSYSSASPFCLEAVNTMYHFDGTRLIPWFGKETIYTGTSPITVSDKTISHANSGVVAASKGETANRAPGFGDTFKVLSGTVNVTGHLTAFTEHTVKIPATEASDTAAGLMSATDHKKLEGVEESATATAGSYFGTCSTIIGTAAKVVECEGYTLRTGNMIAVLFTSGGTTSALTLNVNETGAHSVYVGNASASGTTNVCKWSSNTVLYFVYDGSYYRYLGQAPDAGKSWYGTCDKAAGTAAKTVTCANYRLQAGSLISVTFETANTAAAPTLNVNSTGAKAIYVNNAVTSASNLLEWDAGEQLTFIYSGSYYYLVAKSKPTIGDAYSSASFSVTFVDGAGDQLITKQGKRVHLSFWGSFNTTSGSWSTIGTVPEGFRPAKTERIVLPLYTALGTWASFGIAEISSEGVFRIGGNRTGTSVWTFNFDYDV